MSNLWDAAWELERATSVSDLLPLNAAAAGAVATRLIEMSRSLGDANQTLESLRSMPEWKGDAGRAFEARVEKLPPESAKGCEVFDVCGRQFRLLAETIANATPQIVDAFSQYQMAKTQSARWERGVAEAFRTGEAPAGLPRHDPGHEMAEHAIARYAEAKEAMAKAVDDAGGTLVLAGEVAPGFGDLLGGGPGVLETVGGIGLGIWDGLWGAAEFAGDFNPTRMVIDPGGYLDDLKDVGTGLKYLWDNPDQIDDILLDLEMLREDPARWFGQMVAVELLLAVSTQGASVGVKATQKALSKTGRAGRFLAKHLNEIDLVAGGLGLPSFSKLAGLPHSTIRQRALQAARKARTDETDEELGHYAAEHGGRPEDYEKKIATLEVDDDGNEITFEFVHNTETDEIYTPRLVNGELCEAG